MNTMKTFKVGEILRTRSICDYDCIFEAIVLSRTAKMVTIEEQGEIKKRRIFIDACGNEAIKPHGRYSMSATFHAGDDMNTVPVNGEEEENNVVEFKKAQDEKVKKIVDEFAELTQEQEPTEVEVEWVQLPAPNSYCENHAFDAAVENTEQQEIEEIKQRAQSMNTEQLENLIDELEKIRLQKRITRTYHTTVAHENNSRVIAKVYKVNYPQLDSESWEYELIIDGEVKGVHEYEKRATCISEAISLVSLNAKKL